MTPPIFTPDGTEVEEVILPDGSVASEVIAPDGTVVFDAMPDSGLQHEYDARVLSSATTFDDQIGDNDLPENGSPSLVSDGINGQQAVEYDGDTDFHGANDESGLSTAGDYTFAFVINTLSDVSERQTIGGQTNQSGFRTSVSSGEWRAVHPGRFAENGGTVNTNEVYVGVQTYDSDNDALTLQIGDSVVISHTGGAADRDDEMALGFDPDENSFEAEIYLGHALYYNEHYDADGRGGIVSALESSWGITSADG